MSNYLAIAAVTATLRQHLEALIPDVIGERNVTIRRPGPPDAADADTPRVNLFLYRVLPDPDTRNAHQPVRAADGTLRARPAAGVLLDYLISCGGNEDQLLPQRLVGAIVAGLEARPVLTSASLRRTVDALSDANADPSHAYLRGSNVGEAGESVRITPTALDMDEMSRLWTAFQSPFALSVAYRVGPLLIEFDASISEVPQVTDRHFDLSLADRRAS